MTKVLNVLECEHEHAYQMSCIWVCGVVVITRVSASALVCVDTPFCSDLYPSPLVPVTRNQMATKMISTVCGAQ